MARLTSLINADDRTDVSTPLPPEIVKYIWDRRLVREEVDPANGFPSRFMRLKRVFSAG